ncbi:MAG: taurine catabolism dioxygenase TauD [Microscillaceae bacterium]|nr:taurine catabolism dioxygenase TauD [Microscillaceae bacterium]
MSPASPGAQSKASLLDWIAQNKAWLETQLSQAGAILFRGYALQTASDFEEIALALDPKLQAHYYGTSPRLNNTVYTFSASELPPHYPIMQHCEMSFLKNAPRRIFFFCETPAPEGGETPLTDFRKVYQQLDPAIRAAFEQKGIRNIRNYFGPRSKGGLAISGKTWDDMFKTTDREEVARQCREQGLAHIWPGNDRLTLINEQPAVRIHPQTGEKVWFNHSQVFHTAAPAIEYAHIAQRQKQLSRQLLRWVLAGLVWYRRQFRDTYDQEMHVTFADGTEIPRAYIAHLLEVIWKNQVFLDWQRGDLVMLDNFAVAHGRMPFRGPRNIMVAWTDGLARP